MRNSFTNLALLVVVLLISIPLFGQNELTPLMVKIQQSKTKKLFQPTALFGYQGNLDEMPQAKSALSVGHILELKPEWLNKTVKSKDEAIELEIPLGSQGNLIMDLILFENLTNEFQVITSSSNGQPVKYKKGLHYRGTVRGASQSIAAISIFDGEVIGVISTLEDGDMVLGKTQFDKNKYIFYKEDDLLVDNDFQCGADNPEITKIDLKKLKQISGNQADKNLTNCVQVYLECEHDMFLENGTVQATVNYMTGLFNVVATLYQNEQITTQISEIFVWDTPDSYPTNSTSNALTAFRNTRSSFNGDLAHLISRGAPAGGGVAWVDALCTSYNYAYSYVNDTYQVFPTYSWSVEVVTHEMGHNLGSPHTHACSWNGNNTAIDGCGPAAGYSEGCNAAVPAEGTIMSYCHLVGGVGINFNLGFGPQPGDRIRDRITNASCLTSCGNCTLTVAMTGTPANGGNNGTATATASDGTQPYSYVWSNGGSTATISGLAPGTYGVTVTDDEGCFVTGSYTVEDVTPCSDNNVTLTIILDNYPGETTWEIQGAGGNVLASGGPYSTVGATVIEEACLPDACYDFIIYDSYGDGICCAYGIGSYSLVDDTSGDVLASGGAFASSESTNFCLPTGGGGGGGGCTYSVINANDFEGGWGIWNDGGSDARRSANDASYASNGNYCVRLRDNTSTSVMTTDNIDMSGYDEIEVAFGYYPRSMDNSNEDFWLQISTNGGASYTTVEEWNRDDEFVNNNFYTDAVTIAGPFSANTRLRFRCDASGNSDWVYIDEVTISGCSNTGNMMINPNDEIGQSNGLTVPSISNTLNPDQGLKLFPNPAHSELTVAYQLQEMDAAEILIMDFTGRVLRNITVNGQQAQERINVSDLQPGYYMVQVVAGTERMNQKFVIAR